MIEFNKAMVSKMTLEPRVADLPENFTTADVANHAGIQRALSKYVDHDRFQQVIGGALNEHAERLGIERVSRSSNAKWRKVVDEEE